MNAALESPVAGINPYRTRILKGFDDPSFGPAVWNALVARGETNAINMTWQMHAAWWEANARGTLLPVVVERHGAPIALAPMFADGGMVFNICLLDYLDFIGDTRDPAVIEAILSTAREAVPGFVGFRFYFIPEHSPTSKRLQTVALRLGLQCVEEGALQCPAMDIVGRSEAALRATRKQSLMRHERALTREGAIQVRHYRAADDIFPQLPAFFDQHVARRAVTDHPSAFEQSSERHFYERMTVLAGAAGWLRFTRLDWRDRAIAFHYGFSYGGRYLFGVPSFDIDLARYGVGEVLLRHVLLEAIAEGAAVFDFGIGDEAYKHRFATRVPRLVTWGLYPRSGVTD